MEYLPQHLQQFPPSARKAVLLLFAGWLILLVSLYTYFLPGYDLIRFVIIGVLMCFFTYQAYPWARVLCLVGDAMVIVYFSLIATQLFRVGRLTGALIASVIVIVFAASGWFLLVRESANFFKTFRSSTDDAQDAGGNGR
jgi:hypothetical protein